MNIFNIEKLDLSKTVVLTGRNEHVRAIARELKATLYYLPSYEDHYTDYPAIIQSFKHNVENKSGTVILTTQSAEFLDCLLESDFDFTQATVRHYDDDNNYPYRLRVLNKADALANRKAFNFEMRI